MDVKLQWEVYVLSRYCLERERNEILVLLRLIQGMELTTYMAEVSL